MKNVRVAAVIIVFHADKSRLKENCISIVDQVSEIIFVVNGNESEPCIDECRSLGKTSVIVNDENMGIARALNQGLMLAKEKGYNWAITLDQDSVSTPNMLQIMTQHCQDRRIGIIAPFASDRNVKKVKQTKTGTAFVKMAITSGSLHSISAWEKVGGYKEELFIDCVDNEFDARLIRNGYTILKDENAELIHEIGNSREIRFLGRDYVLRNYPPFRYYYLFRNLRYFYIMYPEFASGTSRAESKRYELFVRFWMTLLFEKQKTQKMKAMVLGFIDSRKMITNERKGK